MDLTSPEFKDGEYMPEEFGYEAENVNPPLEIGNVPDDADALALVMDDPDAQEPAGKIWDHWVVWNLDPGREAIPRDWGADDATEGENDYGEHGYGGPNPPDREHSYRFRLYALADEVDVPPGSSADDLQDAMEGQVLVEDELRGTYTP